MRRTDSIRESAQALRCTYIRDNIDAFVEEAALEEYGVAEAIDVLFSRELETRRANTIRRNTMAARFPYRMDFGSFETSHLSPEVRREARRLSTLQFVADRANVVLVGNPGVGKTALAVACGHAACAEGMRVSFVSVPNLVTEVKEAMSLNELTRYRRNFERYDLVILDDLGYCSFSKECGEVLFNLLSNRNQKGSMVITTNLTFDRWNEVFKDEVLTGAIVDRVGHKAHVVDMTGESYRVIETERWLREPWKEDSAT
jgi:DNA replication protein DnaC